MKKDPKGVVDRLKARILPENRLFVKKNLAVSEQVNYMLGQRGWSQKILAGKMGKETSEVSKWLSGLHNLTLQSISKMESVFNEEILITPLKARKKFNKTEYIVLKVFAQSNNPEKPQKIAYEENVFIEKRPCNIKVA
ncbi:MAG: XRE family transcriptional regulator [Alphaproteobacteria bacterium]|nr:XRE family transcriptional regulator [Alphaproteobacteria bacterium]